MTAICDRNCFECLFCDCVLPEDDISHNEKRLADKRDRIARLISPQSYPRKPYKPQRKAVHKRHQTNKTATLRGKQEYYRKNRDAILEKKATYYQNNRERILLQHAEWREKNRESIKKYQHEYYLKHKTGEKP